MRRFIHSSLFRDLLQGSKIVIIDGGARGELFPPFNAVSPDLLQIIKVEPDADASVARAFNEVVFNKAIWSEETAIDIHIANEPSVSSVYPPNIKLASRFIDIIGEPARRTKQVVRVQAAAIDQLFEQEQLPYPDFIKLDIHGCEYEALSGALKSLEAKTVALVIESWVIEAHLNQKLLFKTDELLHGFGFYPHETTTGSWDYKNAADLHSKPQAMISESLYFKDTIVRDETLDLIRGIKLIAIAELYGHVGYSLLLADHLLEKNVLDETTHGLIVAEIRTNNKRSAWHKFTTRVRNKLIRMLSDKKDLT